MPRLRLLAQRASTIITIRTLSFCSSLAYVMSSPYAARAAHPSQADRAPVCAQFSSRETGTIAIVQLGTNQPDAVDPIGPVTRAHLSLARATDEVRFVRLANDHTSIASAVISGARADASFRIRRARVIGYSPIEPSQASTHPLIELEIGSWTALKQDNVRSSRPNIMGRQAC
jgi:hypothetical protein